MHVTHLLRAGAHAWLALALLCLVLAPRLLAQATGTIEGRVTNPATGGVFENARISVVGSPQEALTDSGGYYRLDGVVAGAAQVRVFFSGFAPATAAVNVAAGQTVQRDFQLSPVASVRDTAAKADGSVVKLDEFVVATSREMSGAALAINEQRFAPNIKSVVSTDEFGDIAEGNVAEFVKFMPGVNIDYAGGNARDISLNGVPSIYVPVTLDGFVRSNELRGTRLTEPASALPCESGVGENDTSMRERLLIETWSRPTPREVPPAPPPTALARPKPSSVTGT